MDYLRPIYENEYSISDIQKFPSMFSLITPLQDDEEDVLYDYELLFTNIAKEETVNEIIERIYFFKKLMAIGSNFQKIIDKSTYRMYF